MIDDETYSPKEAARRRDAVVRRMANTPPQKAKPKSHKKKKPTGQGRAAKKGRATS